ncbi:MAG: hypothetical protein RR066_03930, partial [Mucinivorans sp.]
MVEKPLATLIELENSLAKLLDEKDAFALGTTIAISALGYGCAEFVAHELLLRRSIEALPRLTLEGKIGEQKATLTVPRLTEMMWRLELEKRNGATFSEILAQAGITEHSQYFPASILSFVALDIQNQRVEFNRNGTKTCIHIAFKPSGNAHWVVIPNMISMSDPTFRLSVTHGTNSQNKRSTMIKMSVGGRITVGEILAEVEVTMGVQRPWLLTFKSDTLTIGELANMVFGGRKSDITDKMPSGLLPVDTDLALKSADLTIDSQTPAVTNVGFAIAQVGRWEVLPSVTIYDWELLMVV